MKLKIREVKDLNALLIKLNLTCKFCSQEKAIIVDRSKGTIPVDTLGSDGKVKSMQCYPTYRHPLYCPYHLRLKGGD